MIAAIKIQDDEIIKASSNCSNKQVNLESQIS